MSAMAKMIADMVLKEMPEEVRLMLTPENLFNLQQNIVVRWKAYEASIEAVKTAQNATLEQTHLNTGMLADIQETLSRIEAHAAGSGRSNPKPRLVSGGSGSSKRAAT